MRGILFATARRAIAGCMLALSTHLLAGADAAVLEIRPPFPVVTYVVQLAHAASRNPSISSFVRLEGNVWWVNRAKGQMVLQDATGAELLEINLPDFAVQPGQRVRLEGNGTIARRGAGFRIGTKGPVVDNNGVHPMIEKSGAVFLRAGLQPIQVEWFNGVEKSGLEVEYEGPELPRQRIPDSALFRMPADAGATTNRESGLNYRCCESAGQLLPDFAVLPAIKSGTVSNFDLSVAARAERVALQFTGFLEVPCDGSYTFYTRSDDGSRLFVGGPSFGLEVLGPGELPAPRELAPGQPIHDGEGCQWVRTEGTVRFVSERAGGFELELSAGIGRMRVELTDGTGLSPETLLNRRIRATGVCQSAYTVDGQTASGVLLVSGCGEIEFLEPMRASDTNPPPNPAGLPLLMTAGEVHRLKREEAERGYPVKMRGVITCVLPEHQAFTIEDSTRGLYVVDFSDSRSAPPQVGEFLEVEGTTDPSLFAPIVNARRVRGLGAGRLPEPVRPTWDQLMNGSLDAQYVEVQGIITATQGNTVTLFTRGGIVKVELRPNGLKLEELKRFEDALVRVRGCLLALWDYVTHQVKMGETRIYNADIMIDQRAPADLFSIPAKTAAELLFFDPQASVFQRVKVSGQILHRRESEYLMAQGGSGLRFVTKRPVEFGVGDLVEVVGFPDLLSSASPVLREAVARKTGQAPLPEGRKLSPDELIRAVNDATRVRVEGRLVAMRRTRTEYLLEMQSGVRTFVARLDAARGSVESLPPGTQLELAGVYAGWGGNRAGGQDIASFELLLNSPADLKVLARPPWWTLERLLVIVGVLACILAATVLWITQLHRQVEERTSQLGQQIRAREQVEHQRAIEEERTRIAQDLHDELGSGITEISMLAARARSASAPDEKRHGYLDQVGDNAREMVAALDEIVWAMNPRHDSLGSLVSYFSLYADRFLGLANIAWRLEDASGPTDHAVDSRQRHQLFLAFKEALTNIVRHSAATEVRVSIRLEAGELRLAIADNGRGMTLTVRTEEMNGVANMRERLVKLGGRFEVESGPGSGTTVRFSVPAK